LRVIDQTNGAIVARQRQYPEVVRMIVNQNGLAGLFGRGLQIRLLINGIQGAMFSVLWKYFATAGERFLVQQIWMVDVMLTLSLGPRLFTNGIQCVMFSEYCS
jgi:hypothetical protein